LKEEEEGEEKKGGRGRRRKESGGCCVLVGRKNSKSTKISIFVTFKCNKVNKPYLFFSMTTII